MPSPKHQSYIEMPSATLITKCDARINSIEAYWQQQVEAVVAKLIAPSQPSWLDRLLRRPRNTVTREEALNFIKPHSDDWSYERPWTSIHATYRQQYDTCQLLRQLASEAPTVYLTAEDYAFL